MAVLRKISGITRRDKRRNADMLKDWKELQMEKDINEVQYYRHAV